MNKLPKLAGTVTVGDRGQIVVPADARESLEIKSGDKLLVFIDPNCDGLIVTKPESFERHMQAMSENLDHTRNQVKDADKQ
ncbi:TPA: AbrB/MazE/SpoVT family DNA-binding domain-containing protein [Candidatus Saccharibacteria bacterium]|nr:AbrB/MazE/SpoVT family DNA-binding domain-containing protein [Candidatus Saccharibacteria bacterium]HIO87311.1 AbrB/MazE/SpoVT family DNA-binding domain-containing protein [Candidatus Saccharibacteria bacterium]